MHHEPVAEGRIIATTPRDERRQSILDRERAKIAERHDELERLSLFVRARRNAYGWSKPAVAVRADSIGEAYVSKRTLDNIEHMEKASYKPRTLRRLNMALHVPLGTAERVLAGPDADPDYDPASSTPEQWLLALADMPELVPPRQATKRPRGLATPQEAPSRRSAHGALS